MTDKLTPIQQELLNRADSIFAYVGEAAAKAADFAGREVPDIALQYIAYNRVYLSVIVGLAFVVLALHQFLMIRFCLAKDKHFDTSGRYNDDGHWMLYIVTSIFIWLGTIIVIFGNIKDLIMVWVAPKIFLIEHIVHLVKS